MTKGLFRIILITGLLSNTVAQEALAQDPLAAAPRVQAWEETFSTEAVAPHATGSLIVVPAGQGDALEEAKRAAAALVGALQEQPGVELVMDSAILGESVSALDDEAIVARASGKSDSKINLPLTTVIIVRAFAGAQRDAYSLVVSWYDRESGAARYALSVKPGDPLPAPPGGASSGVSRATQEAVAQREGASPVDRPAPISNQEAIRAYERRYVWFEDWVGVDARSGALVAHWTQPYKGKFKEPLEGEEFYEEIGQQELASQYATTSNIRTGVLLGGGLLTLAGVGAMILPVAGVGQEDCDSLGFLSDEYTQCQDENTDTTLTWLVGGAVVASVGSIGMLVASWINPHPVEPHEARQLAGEHNDRLRDELELPERDASQPYRFDLGVGVGPDGGALHLTIDY